MNRVSTWLRGITGGAAVYPLVVLFGLNAVDELDRTAFGVLLPEIREDFGLDIQGMLTLLGAVGLLALSLQVPIAALADRFSRVRLAWIGALAWAVFSFLTGLAGTVVVLAVVRAGSAVGKAVVDPTHGSILADTYEPAVRPKVFSAHRAANAVGGVVGPVTAGLMASVWGWRAPFFVFAVPTLVFVVLAMRMKDPNRGEHERRLAGAEGAALSTEEPVPSFAEGWRTVWSIPSLKRMWWSLPFLASSLIGFVSIASLFYDEVFDLDERARGFAAAAVEPAQLLGLVVGARIGTKRLMEGPGAVIGFLSKMPLIVSVGLLGFALAPNIGLAMVANAVVTGTLAMIAPGILAALSLAIPPRARAMGFSVASLWIIPGLAVLPFIGWIGDQYGLRPAMLTMVPIFFIGGAVLASSRGLIDADVAEVRTAAAARSAAAAARAAGKAPLLTVRDLRVGYGPIRVLHGVDLDVHEGEVLALLGTNGAGKSTLLKAVAGVTEADGGVVVFDGRDVTHTPPHELSNFGVSLMPGGSAVFPSLSVEDNLRVAGWRGAGEGDPLAAFPALAARRKVAAGDLSGGQQQQLGLAMDLLAAPRLLMIDELSLGLAPVIVAELLPLVAKAKERGTSVIIVEQSVDLALSIADRAMFLEKGTVRFAGPAAELRGRTDLLRAVFLPSGSTDDAEHADAAADTGTAEHADAAGDAAADTGTAARATNGAHATPLTVIDDAPVADDGAAVEVATGGEERSAVALSVSGATATFGGVRAVDDVSLTVRRGEIVGLIGPNGAGKTTLFDLLSGHLGRNRGRIELDGHDITGLRAHQRARAGLGRSFQDAALFPGLTVAEVVSVACERWIQVRDPVSAALRTPASYDSEREIATRVEELLDLLGLQRYRHTSAGELSTGTRRVVDVACLLAHRPSVILLDEPAAGIAQREVEALAPLVRRVRDESDASVLVVEHDIPFVRSIADRLIAMDRGRIIAEGPPAEVLAHPLVVASYLGTDDAAIERSGAGVGAGRA